MSRGGLQYLIAFLVLVPAASIAQYNNPRYQGKGSPVYESAPAAPSGASARTRGVARPSPTPAPETHPIEWSFHGKAFTDLYVFTNGVQGGEVAQSNLSFWPELEAKFNEQWSAKGVLAANLFLKSLDEPNKVTTKANLREGFVTYQKSGFELRAGQQIIPWGKSDGINPTDYFTAKDYTFYTPDDELRRKGELSLSLSLTPRGGESPWNIQAVFQARYPVADLIIPSSFALPAGIRFQKDAPVPRYFNPEDMQGGVRLQYLGTDFDFSLSAFRGTSVFPQYQFNPSVPQVEAFHPQQTAFGGDVSFNLGESSVVRVETAFLLPDNGTPSDVFYGLVLPYHWDTVAGIERAFGESWRVQAQMFLRYNLYFRAPSEFNDGNPVTTQLQQAIGRGNALLLNFPEQTVPGSTLRVAYAPATSAWNAEVFMVGYFTSSSGYLLRPSLGYKPMDDLKVQAGFDLYGGDSTQTLGSLHDRSAVFGEVKWFF